MIFKKDDSLLFHKKNLEKARAFYEQYGKKTIILARFMPGVRTFAPILAGVGNMNYQTFFSYNLIGGLLWGMGLPALGYFLGNTVPNIDKYLLPIIVLIVFVSVLPSLIHVLKNKPDREKIIGFIKSKLKFLYLKSFAKLKNLL